MVGKPSGRNFFTRAALRIMTWSSKAWRHGPGAGIDNDIFDAGLVQFGRQLGHLIQVGSL